MAMTIIASIVVASIITLSFFIVYMIREDLKKKQAALLIQFSKLGSRYGMSFTSQEILLQRIIGFDGIMQKILVFETGNKAIDWYLVNLKNVKSCEFKVIIDNETVQEYDYKQPNEQIDTIGLKFSFKSDQPNIMLPFYERNTNTSDEQADLAHKAKYWEVMLCKMLMQEVKRA